MRRGPSRLRTLAAFTIASLVLNLALVSGSASRALANTGSIGDQDLGQLTAIGTAQLDNGGTGGDGAAVDPSTEFSNVDLESGMEEIVGAVAPARGTFAPATLPEAKPQGFTASNPGFTGFNGLTHRDQRNAGTGRFLNTQFSLEPPDQALCVGNGFVVESVNTALAVYSATGTRLSGPTPLNQFFGLNPEVIRSTPRVFGEFTSDPKCYFDAETGRFFLTLLEIDTNPANGAFRGHSDVLIATSTSGDPTAAWRTFRLNVTGDGNPPPGGRPCPCFGDQPLIGADHFGFYVSTNAFRIFSPQFFRGPQLYAMSKWALAAGTTPAVVHIGGLRFSVPDGTAASIQPATMPGSGSDFDQGDLDENEGGGTEYFVSSQLLLDGPRNHIAVWALNGTGTLTSATPSVTLSQQLISSQSYDVPPDATQKAGSRPLGASLGAPISLLSTNDHRMQQVVFAHGRLWTALTTDILPRGDSIDRAGIAWFIIKPGSSDDGAFRPRVDKQGYVSVSGGYLMYPSIGVDRVGRGVMSFSFSSAQHFPSVGYVNLNRTGKVGAVHTAAAGAGPADGFTGYAAFGGTGSERWGDYSAATDSSGNVWFANEYIPNLQRSSLANWGTFIGRVTPSDDEGD